jgi:hypothetical protein
MFWERKTEGNEYEKALKLGSTHWSDEIQRLKAELAEIDVERAALTTAAGQALLDGDQARAAEIQTALAGFASREVMIGAAVLAAEARRDDAMVEERRHQITGMIRQYHGLLVPYIESHKVVKAAERALSEAVAARHAVANSEQRDSPYRELQRVGLPPRSDRGHPGPGNHAELYRTQFAAEPEAATAA